MASALRRKLPLIILVAVCATPAIGPYLLWFFWQPTEYSNYGELVESRMLPAIRLDPLSPVPVEGAPMPAPASTPTAASEATLRGKWFLLMADAGGCDERCERKLYHLRQLRTMQGKEMERVERVWLIDDRDGPSERLLGPYAGTWIVRQPDTALLDALPVPTGGDRRDHIYLVDPLGNIVLRYPPDADPSRIRKDMTRLLKYSRIG
jgi:hypothetical protein